jgi:hypothetical protein
MDHQNSTTAHARHNLSNERSWKSWKGLNVPRLNIRAINTNINTIISIIDLLLPICHKIELRSTSTRFQWAFAAWERQKNAIPRLDSKPFRLIEIKHRFQIRLSLFRASAKNVRTRLRRWLFLSKLLVLIAFCYRWNQETDKIIFDGFEKSLGSWLGFIAESCVWIWLDSLVPSRVHPVAHQNVNAKQKNSERVNNIAWGNFRQSNMFRIYYWAKQIWTLMWIKPVLQWPMIISRIHARLELEQNCRIALTTWSRKYLRKAFWIETV